MRKLHGWLRFYHADKVDLRIAVTFILSWTQLCILRISILDVHLHVVSKEGSLGPLGCHIKKLVLRKLCRSGTSAGSGESNNGYLDLEIQ